MGKLKRGRARRLVLDVGSSAVRFCELAQTKTGYQLVKYYQREMLIDPAADEEEKRRIRRETLKQLLKDAKIRAKKTILAVPGQSVFTRPRTLPPVPEYKLTQIVRYEIQQQIPFSLDQIALDYQVLNRTEAGGYDVMMAAIKVDVVEKHLEVLRDVKRRIETVDVSPLAAYNWLKHAGELGDQGECVALLDLGAATTDIVIERENQFRFPRSINVGGNDITAAISQAFGVSFAEAEKLKRERGFAPTGDPQRDGKGGEVIGRVLSRLVSEITRSFAYFRSQPGGGTVARAVITGGGSCLRNIVPYLQRQLGVEVRIAQPLAGLAIGPEAQEVGEHPEQASVVLGLALRACERVPIEINLIPPRILEAARRREQVFVWGLVFVTLGLIAVSVIPQLHNSNKEVLGEIRQLESVVRSYGSPQEKKDLDQLKAEIGRYQSRLANLAKAGEDRQFWLEYLSALNDARPGTGGLWFSSVETTVIGGGFVTTATRQGSAAAAVEGKKPFSSTAFPSLSPFGGAVRVAFRGTLRSAGLRGQTPAQAAEVPPPDSPNGLTVYGYADGPNTVLEFVENLKVGGKFPVGVYFDDTTVQKSPMSVLAQAAVGTAASQMSYGPSEVGSSDSEDEDGSRRSNFAVSRSFWDPYAGYAAGTQPEGPTVVSFRVDVQFAGEQVELIPGGVMRGGRGGATTQGGIARVRGRERRSDDRE